MEAGYYRLLFLLHYPAFFMYYVYITFNAVTSHLNQTNNKEDSRNFSYTLVYSIIILRWIIEVEGKDTSYGLRWVHLNYPPYFSRMCIVFSVIPVQIAQFCSASLV